LIVDGKSGALAILFSCSSNPLRFLNSFPAEFTQGWLSMSIPNMQRKWQLRHPFFGIPYLSDFLAGLLTFFAALSEGSGLVFFGLPRADIFDSV
jgi:hypothetical protein